MILVDGVSLYRIPGPTEHVETILRVKTEVDENLVKIQGIGYYPSSSK